MRLGFISTYPPIECGIATYTKYLTTALRKKHVDVNIISHLGANGQKVFPIIDYEDEDLAEKGYSVMMRLTPDIVHIQHEFGLYGKNSGVSVIPLIINFRLSGIPVVTTLHTIYPEISEKQKIIYRSILLNSNQVIVHEDYQKRSLARVLGQEWVGKIRVVPHGAREIEPVPDAKRRLELPTDKKIILLIGYFRPSKNYELIIEVMPKILERYPEAILVLAGKIRGTEHIEYRKMLFELIERSPAKEYIYVIRGQLPQHIFDTILSASDIVALPYKITSQSGIMAHCLAFGRPVVTSGGEAMENLINESRAGLICSDADSYVENIVKILSDPDLSKQFSENARRYVKKYISWSKIADQHLKIYSEIVDRPDIKTHVINVE